jgi:DnaD/phage-associated family protein
MSKTILAQVDGFTPVIDGMIPQLGAFTALVFGKMWRYCQMSDGVCKASQDRIADELGVSRQSINKHIEKLVETGYMEDLTPDLLGMPHQYRDTGRANLSINLTATCQKSLQPPVKNFDTKKESKKDTKKNEDEAALSAISKAYSAEIGIITPMIADELREASMAYPVQWTLDAIHEAATQNKRGWKYVLAILARWKAQGNQEAMKPQQAKKQPVNEPAAFEAIRQFEAMQHGN